MGYLNLASIRPSTDSEGPGKRFAIWCQGCYKRCKKCCNSEMQELRKNIVVDTNDLIKLIQKYIDEEKIEGVSFIGGEPILQAEGLAEIAQWCQANGLSVLLFTGYLFEEIKSWNDPFVNKLIQNTDVVVDEPYIDEEYDDKRDWVGSKNQHVILLTQRYSDGIEFANNNRSMELLVSEKDILVNGWPF